MKKRMFTITLTGLLCLSMFFAVALGAEAETKTIKGKNGAITVTNVIKETTEILPKGHLPKDGQMEVTVLWVEATGSMISFEALNDSFETQLCEYGLWYLAEDSTYSYEADGDFQLEQMEDGTLGFYWWVLLEYRPTYKSGSEIRQYIYGGATVYLAFVNPEADGAPPSSWAAEEVLAAIDAGLVPSHLQKNYGETVTRGDAAQMFINLIEKATGKTIDAYLAEKGLSINADAFTDTDDKAVLAANALGIINGIGGGKFDPEGTFARSQIAAIISRVARCLGVKTQGYSHGFVDVASHWVDGELGWPFQAGIINGVGSNRFAPEEPLTTEQAIVIAYRALLKLT